MTTTLGVPVELQTDRKAGAAPVKSYQNLLLKLAGQSQADESKPATSSNGAVQKVTQEQIARSLQKGSGAKVKQEKERRSVLLRLYQNQNEIALQRGKPAPYQELQK